MFLAARAVDSKVIIDGVDISDMCTGVDVTSHVGEPTVITLHLIANCELTADVPDVDMKRPAAEDEQP